MTVDVALAYTVLLLYMADGTVLYSTYRKVSCMYGSWQDHPYIASMRKVRTIEDPPLSPLAAKPVQDSGGQVVNA